MMVPMKVASLSCGLLLCVGAILASPPSSPRLFPDIHITPLEGGKSVSIREYRGTPVLITFWASWCAPCRQELPELARFAEKNRDFVVLPVTIDRSGQTALRFLEKRNIRIPVYQMRREDRKALGVRSIPTNILLDAEGNIIKIFQGFGPNSLDQIQEILQQQLPEAGDAEEAHN